VALVTNRRVRGVVVEVNRESGLVAVDWRVTSAQTRRLMAADELVVIA
jgi:hypothetical protein